MLEKAITIVMAIHLAAGALGIGCFAMREAWLTIRWMAEPTRTIRADGTPTRETDSFRLRTWLLGLSVPSYRMTAMRGLGELLFSVTFAIAAGGVAALLAAGLVRML